MLRIALALVLVAALAVGVAVYRHSTGGKNCARYSETADGPLFTICRK